MFKKFRLSLTFLGALLAACMMLPQITMAAAQHGSHYKSTTVDMAFVGEITNGIGVGTELNGDLTLQFNPYGNFNGTFTEPDGTKVGAHGAVNPFGQIDITVFLSTKHGVVLQGQGNINSSNDFVGNFEEFAGATELATGSWSAAPTIYPEATTFAFAGQVTTGPDSGTTYDADIVVNNYTGAAFFELVNGTVVPATLLRNGTQVALVVSLGGGQTIVGFGTTGGNRLIGTFTGPSAGDTGFWNAQKIG